MSRPFALAALAVLLLAGAGCTTPCEDLGRRICACQTTTGARDACDRAVKNLVKSAKTNEAEQDACDGWLSTCPNPDTDTNACAFMSTEAGKVACGIAWPTDDLPTTAP